MSSLRPRIAVIEEGWERVAGDRTAQNDPFRVLSGRDGRPLARTVKCLIDPLVLRLRANPDLGRPLLGPEQATQVVTMIAATADTIADAAAWFTALKAGRRAAGITGGNIQEMYFPRAYELAVAHGAPGDDAADIVAQTIIDLHGASTGMSTDDLAVHLEGNHARLDAALDEVWARRIPVHRDTAGVHVADMIDGLLTADTDPVLRQKRWAELISSGCPVDVGSRVFESDTPFAEIMKDCAIAEPSPPPALSSSAPARRPPLRGGPAPFPLDRSIANRVTTTLRRSLDREELPAIVDLVDGEIVRSREPWALEGTVWQAAVLVGVVVAAQLHPLAPQASPHDFVESMSRRVAGQAHIMYNRRYLLESTGDTGGLADDLRQFWRPYLNRLWIRLHGRSVHEPHATARDFDAGDLLSLLDGIARSVSYDQRSRIRAAIERQSR